MQVPKNCKHFLQYTSEVFIPYIHSQAVNIQRTDVVWDCHFQDSLKSETRNNQGARVRTKVFSSVMGKYQITGQHFSVSVIKKVNCFHSYQLNESVEHEMTKLLLLQSTKWLFPDPASAIMLYL